MLKIKIILFFLTLTISGLAQPAGPNNPSTSGDDATVGSLAWANTGNIFTSDNSRARVDLDNNGDVSHYLTATDFGFSIPAGSTINGIVVEIERNDNSVGGNIKDNSVKIIKGGAIVGTDKSSATTWPSSDAYKTYGNATDLWGTTWIVANVNASNFGVAVSSKRTGGGGNNRARIDHIIITVYYTIPTLPVELLSFSAYGNGVSVGLKWETASEDNNDCFIIERSSDGSSFYELSKVKGRGNSSTYNLYKWFDYEPFDGTNYYRLTQLDFNGNRESFPVVSYDFRLEDFEIILNVFDVFGNIVHSTKTMFSKRNQILTISQLPEGVYIFQSMDNNGNAVRTEKHSFHSSDR